MINAYANACKNHLHTHFFFQAAWLQCGTCCDTPVHLSCRYSAIKAARFSLRLSLWFRALVNTRSFTSQALQAGLIIAPLRGFCCYDNHSFPVSVLLLFYCYFFVLCVVLGTAGTCATAAMTASPSRILQKQCRST